MKFRFTLLSMFFIILSSLISLNVYALENNTKEISVNVPQLEELKTMMKESNNNNDKLFYVSVIIAGFTIFTSFLSVKYVRKNTIMTEKEIKKRLRPIVAIQAPKPSSVTLANNQGVLLYDTWRNQGSQPPCESVKVVITIKNIGTDIAKNVTKKFTVQEEIFDKDIFEELDEYTLPDLAPTQEYYQDATISWNDWIQLNTNNIFLGISISYDNYDNRSFSSGIYGLETGTNYIFGAWYDDK